jgi:hypothetical protein
MQTTDVLKNMHDLIGRDIQDDAEFVHNLYEAPVFDRGIGKIIVEGLKVSARNGNYEMRKQNEKKVQYGLSQYQIRVNASGINLEDRTKRAQEAVFLHYINMLSNNKENKMEEVKVICESFGQ